MALPLVTVTMALAAHAHADACVQLRAGTPVYGHRGDTEPVGTTRGVVRAFVVEKGDWYRLRVVAVSDSRPDGLRTTQTEVAVVVPRRAVAPSACPPDANANELGLISEHLGLRWKDGAQAGWTHATSATDAASASSDRVTIDGAPFVCFDEPVVQDLAVHVCGSCAILREAAGHVVHFSDPPKPPCSD
jgi:hypothetical protein